MDKVLPISLYYGKTSKFWDEHGISIRNTGVIPVILYVLEDHAHNWPQVKIPLFCDNRILI